MDTEGAGEALGASYRLLEKLGRGATGEVWRAVDRRTDEVVAAKLLRHEHTSDHDLVGRFVRERSILTALRHPNVVAVRDLVVEGDRLAIIMDFVDGGSLRDVLRSHGPLPPARAVATVAAVLDGLTAAHEQGVLHRDVKPDNVLLSGRWQELRAGDVRLTDFGISRMVAEGGGTTTGLVGTPEYMAPELLVTGTCDLPADVYGTGILLYELLAGRTPFAGPGTDYTVAHRHVASVPPRLPVPGPLWSELSELLDKDPSARPTAAEAAAGLRRLGPALAGLPALERQPPPGGFDTARGPATVFRGMVPAAEPLSAAGPDDDADQPTDLDLGTPDHGTLLRPMTVPRPRRPEESAPGKPVVRQQTARWRDPRAIALVVAAIVLLGGAVAFATSTGGTPPPDPAPTGVTAPVRATQQDLSATTTGLTVSRTAVYDPQSESVDLTVTYAAQNSPLGGPFLEVIPGTGSACPMVSWEGAPQKPSLPSATGVTTPCGWSIDPGAVPEQGATSVTATVSLLVEGEDHSSALQEWLDSAAAATNAAVTDSQLSSTSYPAQRLQGVQVVAPSRTVSGTTLRLTILPVWPNGPDQVNPLYRSPSVGQPSSLLTAVAGGEEGVRFSDGCSGALAVSSGGLVVTALNVAADCTVITTVGNITDVPSNAFDIVTRGS